MPKLDFYLQPYGKYGWGWGGGERSTTDLLLKQNVFRHEYSVLLHEIWQKHGLVNDVVAFIWPRKYYNLRCPFQRQMFSKEKSNTTHGNMIITIMLGIVETVTPIFSNN